MLANVRLSGAQSTPREESDLRFNFSNPQQIIAASTHLGGTQPIHRSGDGGASWQQSELPAFGRPDVRQGDPAVDWTSDGTAWSLTLGISVTLEIVLRCFKSTDAGETWAFESTLPGGQTAMDKEAFWIDHHPASAHRDNMYAIWHNNGPCFVAARAGAGGTWNSPLQVSGGETWGTAVGGDIKTNANGDVFAFWPDTGSQNLFVAKSTDGGAAFGAPVAIGTTHGAFQVFIPAQDGRGVLIYISGGAFSDDRNDFVYACWTDLSGEPGCQTEGEEPGSDAASACKSRIWFSRSTDGGTHWEVPVKINDQASKNDQFFARMALDETSGDLMIIYYDTIAHPNRLEADIWMQSSTDNGVTWSAATKITTASTNETTPTATGNFQYGDYIGLTGHAGQFFACWTDRRSGGVEEIWGAPVLVCEGGGPFPSVNLGSFEGNTSASEAFDGDCTIDNVDDGFSLALESRHGDITIKRKIDQHSSANLTACGAVDIGEKVDQHSQATIVANRDITIGQKIDQHSTATVTSRHGTIEIGQKIDQESHAVLKAGGTVVIGQKIDQHSTATIVAVGDVIIKQGIDQHATADITSENGNILILEAINAQAEATLSAPNGTISVGQVAGGAKVRWHAQSFHCPDAAGGTVTQF
jgi:hypothetical protein